MLSRPELRRRARAQLGGNIFAAGWLSLLLVLLLGDLIVGAGSVIPFGFLLLYGPISYGMTKISMKLARQSNGKVDFGDLFKGFSEDFANTFLLGLMRELFTLLWTLLFIIPGIVKSYSYSMAFYIQNDAPDKDWNTCITESRKMMNGHKWQLFVLDLSFIGWFIVGYLCCGIGLLWVAPYYTQARTNFYEQLRGPVAEEAAPAPEGNAPEEKTAEDPLA